MEYGGDKNRSSLAANLIELGNVDLDDRISRFDHESPPAYHVDSTSPGVAR